MVKTILAVVEDLLFLSKIQQTAKLVGVTVKPADLSKGPDGVAEESPRAVILDLNHRSCSALEVLRELKADPATRDIPVVGFVSHLQADLVAAARAAGCDLVMARSAFTQQLPLLLKKLSAESADTARDA